MAIVVHRCPYSWKVLSAFAFAGFKFQYCEDIVCKQMCKASKTRERRQDIIESKFKLFKMGLMR